MRERERTGQAEAVCLHPNPSPSQTDGPLGPSVNGSVGYRAPVFPYLRPIFITHFVQCKLPHVSVNTVRAKQVHSRKEEKKHNKQTLQASGDIYKMKLKRAAVVTRFDPHSTVADLVHLSVVSLLSQFYLKLITVIFSCKF